MELNKFTSKELLILFNELKKQPICVIYSAVSFTLPILMTIFFLKLLKLKIVLIREVPKKDVNGKTIVVEEEITIDVEKFPKLSKLPHGKFFL